MTREARLNVFVAILSFAFLAVAGKADALRTYDNRGLSTREHSPSTFGGNIVDAMNSIRGGASVIDVDIESSDEEEMDDDDVDDDEGSLGKATKKAASKVVKKSVAAAMKSSQATPIFSKLGNFFKLPYILKACLNPVLLSKMVSGYWKSLYNINYMSENANDSSQDLRSALEQKARYGGGKKSSRGKRKMKPGQSKTLSDLPQLNT